MYTYVGKNKMLTFKLETFNFLRHKIYNFLIFIIFITKTYYL